MPFLPGDHIRTPRGAYFHHGIIVGPEQVVHFAGDASKDLSTARVRLASVNEFAGGRTVEVVPYGRCLPRSEVVRVAMNLLDVAGYHLLRWNCEHFARLCKTGDARSWQVERASGVVGTPGAGVVGSGLALTITTAAGAQYAGGAKIMVGLACVGAPFGFTAAQTAVGLGLLPTAIVVPILRYAYRDDPSAPAEERRARAAARIAAPVAAGVTMLGMVKVISISGVVKGLSAAGISSGLASIGKVVGGRMLAGTFITAFAPVGIAALVAWLAYRAYKAKQAEALTVPALHPVN